MDECKPLELGLRGSLNGWMEELISGAGLQETGIERHRQNRSSTFKHFQHTSLPPLGKGNGDNKDFSRDDFHCPAAPELYIELRLRTAINFYKQRIPNYARWGLTLQILISLSTVWPYEP